jgi:type I restriction enzyme S subunit
MMRWPQKRLKHLAQVRPSNVDKKTIEGEREVLLCNYVDVYKNDSITPDMPFMQATATEEQVQSFELRGDDVLVTKDSEDWRDIAVPAHVMTDMPGVVCGYHLALIRPDREQCCGRYLFYAFQAQSVADQFRVAANGITRYGLAIDDLRTALFPVPSLPEQQSIAAYLDRKTTEIDAVIAAKEQMLGLLQEKRQTLINRAVTRGLKAGVAVKDSGVECLGDVPVHWNITQPKYLSTKIVDGVHATPQYVSAGIPFVTVKNLTAGPGISFVDLNYITREDHQEFSKRANPELGDILIAKDGATLGTVRIIEDHQEFSIFVSVALVKPRRQLVSPRYFAFVLESHAVFQQFLSRQLGSALKHIHLVELRNVYLPLPALEEQQAICEYIDRETACLDRLVTLNREQITRLHEYRQALISAAVTGKIDVRLAEPDEKPEYEAPTGKAGEARLPTP